MSALQLVSEGTTRLDAAGVPEARLKVEWWVSEALGVKREELGLAQVSDEQAAAIESGIARLEKHEPLQHVIGYTPFLNVEIITNRFTLIPRPETEELVSLVLSCDELWSKADVQIADVGTGSGCIAIALAVNKPNAQVTAIDVSPEALETARRSGAKLNIEDRIFFKKNDLLRGIAPASLDVVVSNPPYIASDVIPTLEESVSRYEPVEALDGGPDGLAIIRPLIVQAFTALKKGGRLWLEIGDEQGDPVRGLLVDAGFRDVEIKKDMYGQVRFAEGVKCFPTYHR